MEIDAIRLIFQAMRIARREIPYLQKCANLWNYLDRIYPSPAWKLTRELNFGADFSAHKEWLQYLFTSDPPNADVAGYWFGIFFTEYPKYENACLNNLYIGGTSEFVLTDDSKDWACGTFIWPDREKMDAPELLHEDIFNYSYNNGIKESDRSYLYLAYHIILLNELIPSIDPQVWLQNSRYRGAALGFDEGDFVTLGIFKNGKWERRLRFP